MFEIAWAKRERGHKHVAEFDQLFADFCALPPAQIVGETRYDNSGYLVAVDHLLPIEASLAAGDAIHCFRSALDHCMWEFWEAGALASDGSISKSNVYFPTGLTQSHFEKSVKRLVPTNQRLQDFLLELQCYGDPSARGYPIYCLHQLDILDKHKVVIPTTMGVMVSGFELVQGNAGREVSTSVEPTTVWIKCSATKEHYSRMGMHYGVATVALYTKSENQRVSGGGTLRIKVELDDPKPYPGFSVSDTLRSLSNAVNDIIADLQHYLAPLIVKAP